VQHGNELLSTFLNLHWLAFPIFSNAGLDRRRLPRIEIPFPAIIRGIDSHDQSFEEGSCIDNLCASGLYIRLARQLAPGAQPFVFVQLSITPAADHLCGYLAIHGRVARVDSRPGGIFGTAMTITNYRFFTRFV
jgi:hypothetical protein